MKDMILKSFKINLEKLDKKALGEGKLSVCFATMGVEDKDGDVALPGFYGQQTVAFLPTHDWSHVPMGKGRTYESGEMACADVQMNLGIQSSKDWLSAILFDLDNGEPIQEYSYGFKILPGGSRMGDYNGKQVRYLQPQDGGLPGCKIWEVSPVLVGAGENTRTLAAKAAGTKFCDEVQAVLDAADSLVVRGKSLADLRASQGRGISSANREKLASLAVALESCIKELTKLAAEGDEPTRAELAAKTELLKLYKTRAGLF